MPLLFLALAAACPAEPRTEAGLQQAEDHWIAALEQRDVASLGCRLAPDFTDNDWRGELRTRADMLVALPSRPSSTLKLTEVTTRLSGTIGIVRKVRFTDIFVWRDGRWQAIAAQETVVVSPQP